jgi:hypothetical protein
MHDVIDPLLTNVSYELLDLSRAFNHRLGRYIDRGESRCVTHCFTLPNPHIRLATARAAGISNEQCFRI